MDYDSFDRWQYERARREKMREYDDRMRGFELVFEEPVKKRRTMKKAKYTEVLKIYTEGKGSCQEFSSLENAWAIKVDGVTIYTPNKLKAMKTMFIPVHTITFFTIEKEPIVGKNASLEKLLENNFK